MSYEIFSGTPHLLKLAIRRKKINGKARAAYVFHSWRAILQGRDVPLDANEIEALGDPCPVDLFLVGNESHVKQIDERYGKPALVLPYTVFLPPLFAYAGEEPSYDVVFSCMFREDQLERKRASVFLDFIRAHPDLRAAWIGGYSMYDRWALEREFNDYVNLIDLPAAWGDPWQEHECVHCWQDGVGIFPGAACQLEVYERIRRLVEHERLPIALYLGLPRAQVADVLKRSRCTVVFSTLDQWPRCTTESIAAGVPVVAYNGLLSGLQLFEDHNSVVIDSHEPVTIGAAVRRAWSLDRRKISQHFFEIWGLEACAAQVVEQLQINGVEWDVILDWQRPFEADLKRAVRASYHGAIV